ncbi:MAG: hypothetical protein ACJ0P7_01585 [Flavobacteriaceae bacterium]
MSNSTPKKTDTEEIDLGVLFNSIGKGISKLIAAIGSVIVFLLNTALTAAIFVRKHTKSFAVACVIGLSGGIVLDIITPEEYIGSATLEPHFESARQLYSNIKYLDDLANQNDSIQLAAFFNISPSDASKISSFEIAPFYNENNLLKQYNDYVLDLDSLVAAEITFSDYQKQLDGFERKIHTLTVKSSKQDIFGSLLAPLLKSVSDVGYFKDQQINKLSNLELSDSVTQVSIVQTDSLLSIFEEVRIVEANKEFSNGTNLYMSEKAEDNAEILLLNRKIELTEQLEEIRTEKIKARNVVDVIAAFPEVGYLDKSIWKNKKLQGLILGFLLISLFYAALNIDSFIMSNSEE